MADIARAAGRHPPQARLRRAGLVLRQPGRVQLLPPAVAQRAAARVGADVAPVHRRLAGRQQPVRRQPAALRLAADAAGARRPAHRLPRRHRRQSRSSRTAACVTAPRIRDRMHDIVKRGGRVLVIDPRKTETAAQFEWLGIVPDADAYLLLSLLQVMLAEAPRGPACGDRRPGRRAGLARAAGRAVHPGSHRAAHRHRARHRARPGPRPRRHPARRRLRPDRAPASGAAAR